MEGCATLLQERPARAVPSAPACSPLTILHTLELWHYSLLAGDSCLAALACMQRLPWNCQASLTPP